MKLAGAMAALAILAQETPARAEPDPVLAVAVGAVVEVAGFVAGAAMLGQGSADRGLSRTGWMTIEVGFTVAPVAAHVVNGEWARGLAFGAVPMGCIVGTAGVFASEPDAIDHGSLNEQRVIWALFGLALASSAIGVFDAALVTRRMYVAPTATARSGGLVFGGEL